MMQCIRLTLAEEGVRGFYKGMQSPLAGEGFFNAVQFLVYGASKRMLLTRTEGFGVPRELAAAPPGGPPVAAAAPPGPRSDLTIGEYFAAGALTGFASSFVECPIDLFKSQLQTQIFRSTPEFTTFPQAVAHALHLNGPAGLWQGLSGTFVRTIPATACYFGVYELTKQLQVAPGQSKQDLGPGELLLAGGCGGMAYWLSSFPMDTVKSSMQGDAMRRSERRYNGWIDCARKLYVEGGVGRFWRGIAPCLIRSFPANAACFYAYERSLAFMDKL
jgi:solute carrier family 25 carnitine/acylcarnitine transporter 20/29